MENEDDEMVSCGLENIYSSGGYISCHWFFLVNIFLFEIVTSHNLKKKKMYGESPLNGKLNMLVIYLYSVRSLYQMFAWNLHICCHSQESAPAGLAGNYAQVAKTQYACTSREKQLTQSFILWIALKPWQCAQKYKYSKLLAF